MRSLLRLMRPDNFEDISAVLALYRPGPDGRELAHQLRAAQERPAADHADPPRAGRAARGDPRHHLRPDRLPGAGAGRRAEARRVHPRPGRPAAPRDGQEEEGDPRQGVRAASRRACASAATPTRRSRPCGTSSSRSPTTPSTRRTPPRTAWSPTGRPTSRPTTRPSTWPALLTSVRDDKDKSALYLGECRRMGITVLPPDVNSSSANFTAVGADIRFGLTAVRNVGANVVDAIVAAREEKGAFTSFTDFLDKVPGGGLQQADHRVAHQGRRVRLARARPPRAAAGARAGGRRGHRRQAQGGRGAVRPVRRPRRAATTPATASRSTCPDLPDWDKKQRLAFEREMLGLYVSDHPLSGLEHVLAAAADCSIATLLRRRGAAGRLDGRRSPA